MPASTSCSPPRCAHLELGLTRGACGQLGGAVGLGCGSGGHLRAFELLHDLRRAPVVPRVQALLGLVVRLVAVAAEEEVVSSEVLSLFSAAELMSAVSSKYSVPTETHARYRDTICAARRTNFHTQAT